ncbi:MAG TPA: EAL domain-containing protein [Thermoanaerobaculia bacterium]|nr:EAL domain-containing protein [Thermoanaerobaculia bacterium]
MTALLEIIKGGTLSVRYQAIIEPHDRSYTVHAYEALARGPKGTNLERADVLFEYVRRKREESAVDRLCAALAVREAAHLPASHLLSINVHASTLVRDHDFVGDLLRMAEGYDLEPSRLILEILEHTPMLDDATLQNVLRSLRAKGVRIALDDIGHHGANYQMILDCRPDYFKLDRYFVQGIENDPYRRAIVDSIARLARGFGARTVAEGVETEAQYAELRALGIDYFQGFLFHRPVPAAAIEQPVPLRSRRHAE